MATAGQRSFAVDYTYTASLLSDIESDEAAWVHTVVAGIGDTRWADYVWSDPVG